MYELVDNWFSVTVEDTVDPDCTHSKKKTADMFLFRYFPSHHPV